MSDAMDLLTFSTILTTNVGPLVSKFVSCDPGASTLPDDGPTWGHRKLRGSIETLRRFLDNATQVLTHGFVVGFYANGNHDSATMSSDSYLGHATFEKGCFHSDRSAGKPGRAALSTDIKYFATNGKFNIAIFNLDSGQTVAASKLRVQWGFRPDDGGA